MNLSAFVKIVVFQIYSLAIFVPIFWMVEKRTVVKVGLALFLIIVTALVVANATQKNAAVAKANANVLQSLSVDFCSEASSFANFRTVSTVSALDDNIRGVFTSLPRCDTSADQLDTLLLKADSFLEFYLSETILLGNLITSKKSDMSVMNALNQTSIHYFEPLKLQLSSACTPDVSQTANVLFDTITYVQVMDGTSVMLGLSSLYRYVSTHCPDATGSVIDFAATAAPSFTTTSSLQLPSFLTHNFFSALTGQDERKADLEQLRNLRVFPEDLRPFVLRVIGALRFSWTLQSALDSVSAEIQNICSSTQLNICLNLQATTEAVTEFLTEAVTETVTEAVTETVTEAVTEATTEQVTEPVTEATNGAEDEGRRRRKIRAVARLGLGERIPKPERVASYREQLTRGN